MLTIRQQIFSNEWLKQFVQDFMAMPNRIHDAEDNLAKSDFDLSTYTLDKDAAEELETFESDAAFEVAAAVDENGKKLYSNETQRKAAISALLLKDERYVAAKNKVVQAKHKKQQLALDLAKCRNILNGVKSQYYAMKDLAAIVAGLSHESIESKKLELIARKTAILEGAVKQIKETPDNADF